MKKSLADFLLGLQDWEETGMDADLCSGFYMYYIIIIYITYIRMENID